MNVGKNKLYSMRDGIVMKTSIPKMVGLQPKQMEWLNWVFTTIDGRRFIKWCEFTLETRTALKWIWINGEYDKANDSAILNDILGLYKEWMIDNRGETGFKKITV
jgi:hypothetical protein